MKRITGLVLAGGKSSRMGTDKAWLDEAGLPLAVRQAKVLAGTFEHVVISTQDQRFAAYGFPLLADDIPDAGPAGAIVTAFRRLDCDGIFVLACDMPGVTAAVFHEIYSALQPGYDAVVPVWQGQLQPVCALYMASCRDIFESAVRQGNLRMQDILLQIKVRELVLWKETDEDHEGHDLRNMNTPEEWQDYKNNL